MKVVFGLPLAAIFFLTFCACDDDLQTQNSGSSDLQIPEGPASIAVRKILDDIPGSCVGNENSHPLCAKVTLGFEPRQPSAKSRGRRILVMDTGMLLPVVTRYRSRVVQYLEFDENGRLKTITEEKTLFAGAAKIYEMLDREFPLTSPEELRGVKKAFSTKFGSAISIFDGVQHGLSIFNKLAELNPEAEFFIIDDLSSPQPKRDLFCSNESLDESLAEHRQEVQKRAQEIVSLVRKNGISYANFSFSAPFEFWETFARTQCPRSSHFLSDGVPQGYYSIDIEHFYKPLYTLPNFVVINAIENNVDFTDTAVRRNWQVDCASFPNQLRVSGTSILDPIDSAGVPANHFSGTIDTRQFACADVVINLGPMLSGDDTARVQPISYFSSNGISSFGLYDPSSSHAAPIALSYLMFLNRECPECPPEQILGKLKLGYPIIADPIRNRQFEIHTRN